ncbi:hypothetical protein BCPG_03164 [Burkholderia cenocepacia PC184]|nr:hypothetical protein BCPG_03164 [Burkholderia cenocepacia PC184]
MAADHGAGRDRVRPHGRGERHGRHRSRAGIGRDAGGRRGRGRARDRRLAGAAPRRSVRRARLEADRIARRADRWRGRRQPAARPAPHRVRIVRGKRPGAADERPDSWGRVMRRKPALGPLNS